MKPTIEISKKRKLIGLALKMSNTDNKTYDLWKNFMHSRNEIESRLGTDLFSLSVYDPQYFNSYDPSGVFEKWAAVEVSDFEKIPWGMKKLELQEGLYAKFLYKGTASKGFEFFQYIFGTWLPASDYILDNRPHFEILGKNYRNEDPDSEEEIWIPVKPK